MFITEWNEEEYLRTQKEESKEEGIQQGIDRGEDRLSRLLECLNKDNKSEDMLRVLKDKEYRYQLYKEYNILDN